MKRILVVLVWLIGSCPEARAQGSIWFGNFFTGFTSQPAAVTISVAPGTFNPANGAPGAYVGSDYTASLFFLNGTVTDRAQFDSLGPMLFGAADTHFFGTTGVGQGHGWGADSSGFFDGGNFFVNTASGQVVTIQVRAWYNGGGTYKSYAQALAAGQNVGESNPVPVTLAIGSQVLPNLDGLLPFTVGIVPEPSTLSLLALGGLAMLLRHRARKRL